MAELPIHPTGAPLVVILDFADASTERAAVAAAVPGARVEALDVRTAAAALAHPLLPLADAVLVWHTLRIDAALLARMPRARVLVRVGVGYDNVDVHAAAAVGLPVVNVPNYGTEEVADHAMSLILCVLRRTAWSAAAAASGDEARGSDGVARVAVGTRRLRGLVLGLVGCGRIGTATALRAKAFGFDVAFYDPHVPDGTDKALGIRRAPSLDALAAQAHVLSVHADLNSSSRRCVDARVLALMPRGGFVVNTARGGIVDEAAVAAALRAGHLAGVGFDVHEREPFVGGDAAQPLAGAPNCLCTPHTAFFSDEAYGEMRGLAAAAAVRALTGAPLTNVVNARALERAAAAAGGAPPRAAVTAPREE